jgi:ComF family protein
MAATLRNWAPSVDAIIPVPLSGMRQRTRGYNQAELLAKELARLSGLPMDNGLLKRIRHTSPQTREVDAAARRKNVRSVFSLSREGVPRCVMLVDDVTTTGATLDACARKLIEGGADAVYGLTFARED